MCKDGDKALGSPLRGPRAICIGDGNLWIAMREGNSLWRMDLGKGTMHHVAGNGKSGFAVENGPAKDAEFRAPRGIAFGPDHCVYLCDTGNHTIRRVDPKAGTISTVAGQSTVKKFSGDSGPAAKATLANPHGIGFGPDGTMYIGDSDNHRLRKVAR
jgi:sugar lactone lactonase YvrE